jgi:hypothetical protein
MADELREGAGALALAVAENPRHCDFEIIVQNRDRHAAEKRKCRDVPIEKGFRGLRHVPSLTPCFYFVFYNLSSGGLSISIT